MYEIHHKELGKIIVKPHVRAKNIIARKKEDCILLTVPLRHTSHNIEKALQVLIPKLLATPAPTIKTITENTRIETLTFTARIQPSHLIDDYLLSLKNNELIVFVPPKAEIAHPEVQQKIRNGVLQIMRMEAKRVLPEKTDALAKRFGLKYEQVKINSSRARWGSCSARKSINLSLYLLFLPQAYMEYVILHELAHTVEMNHSPRFWKLLSDMCGEDAKKISRALKKLPLENMAYFG